MTRSGKIKMPDKAPQPMKMVHGFLQRFSRIFRLIRVGRPLSACLSVYDFHGTVRRVTKLDLRPLPEGDSLNRYKAGVLRLPCAPRRPRPFALAHARLAKTTAPNLAAARPFVTFTHVHSPQKSVVKIEPRPLGSGCLLTHSGSVFILCGASRHVTCPENQRTPRHKDTKKSLESLGGLVCDFHPPWRPQGMANCSENRATPVRKWPLADAQRLCFHPWWRQQACDLF
jgi:hypothetical protein